MATFFHNFLRGLSTGTGIIAALGLGAVVVGCAPDDGRPVNSSPTAVSAASGSEGGDGPTLRWSQPATAGGLQNAVQRAVDGLWAGNFDSVFNSLDRDCRMAIRTALVQRVIDTNRAVFKREYPQFDSGSVRVLRVDVRDLDGTSGAARVVIGTQGSKPLQLTKMDLGERHYSYEDDYYQFKYEEGGWRSTLCPF